jgi:hypothetical protein
MFVNMHPLLRYRIMQARQKVLQEQEKEQLAAAEKEQSGELTVLQKAERWSAKGALEKESDIVVIETSSGVKEAIAAAKDKGKGLVVYYGAPESPEGDADAFSNYIAFLKVQRC